MSFYSKEHLGRIYLDYNESVNEYTTNTKYKKDGHKKTDSLTVSAKELGILEKICRIS